MQTRVTFCRCLVVAAVMIALAAPVFSQTAPDNSSKDSGKKDDVSTLKQQVAEQQKEIEQLRSIVNQMKQKLDQSPAAAPAPTAPAPAQTAVVSKPNLGEVASTIPMVPKATEIRRGQRRRHDGSTLIPSAATHPAAQEPAKGGDQEVSPLRSISAAPLYPCGVYGFHQGVVATTPRAVTSAPASGAFPTPRTRAAYSPIRLI